MKRCWSKFTKWPLCRGSNFRDLMCGRMMVVHNTVLCTGNLRREQISGTLTAEIKTETTEGDGYVIELDGNDHFTVYMHVKHPIVHLHIYKFSNKLNVYNENTEPEDYHSLMQLQQCVTS